jgi:YegS/Rv2252/BmrU family lipid kinase
MRVTIIANPKAGHGRTAGAAQQAASVFADAGWTTTIAFTTAAGAACALAREAAAEADLVLACGGDGTLSEVINGLLDTGTPGGLIPAGTGNDFARTIGLPHDPQQAARQLLEGSPQPVDLLEVVGGDRVAINVIGVGFDAAVARRMNEQTRGGILAYLSAVMWELTTLRPTKVRLRVDDREWEGEALLVAVANAQSYGAGMRIAPQASIRDGLLDVVLVRRMSRLRFLRCLPQVFRGAHTCLPEVEIWRGREVRIETDPPGPVLVDGDLHGETPLAVRVLPERLPFWLPR